MKITIAEHTRVIEVGKLKYGTVLTGAPGHPNAVYIKVSKSFGQGIEFRRYLTNCSLLLNLNSGTLRLVPGDSRVNILDAEMNACPAQHIAEHLKEEYVPEFLARLSASKNRY